MVVQLHRTQSHQVLPSGLTFNTTSGIISGTPTSITSQTNYTITATNTGGSATQTITITVNDKAPIFTGYLSSSNTYVLNQAISS